MGICNRRNFPERRPGSLAAMKVLDCQRAAENWKSRSWKEVGMPMNSNLLFSKLGIIGYED